MTAFLKMVPGRHLQRNIERMKVVMRKIQNKAEEQVVLECVEMTGEFEAIRKFAASQGYTITGYLNEKRFTLPLENIYYFEAVDEKVFAYTHKEIYEVKKRLYELEEECRSHHFIRCSKQVILNLMRLTCISPEINGRFVAHMKNDEQIIITRQYVPDLKKVVMGKGENKR